jgi:glutamate dehydrogenase/leucine dehydrogenase
MTKKSGKKPKDVRIAIQGFGNVGSAFAHLAFDAGYTIVGLSDAEGAILSKNGKSIDPSVVYKGKGSINKMYCEGMTCDTQNYYEATNDELLEIECDVLVPAAIEDQITQDNADRIHAQTVIELANGPTTFDADEILTKNGVTIVPDVLANAGGVTVSYFEWVQNIQNQRWTEEDTNQKLADIMIDAYDAVETMAKEKKTTLRNASFINAVSRIDDAMRGRGWV